MCKDGEGILTIRSEDYRSVIMDNDECSGKLFGERNEDYSIKVIFA